MNETSMTTAKVINGIQIWPQEKIERFRTTLLSWYDIEKRDLPWRKNNDPYRIWVSEIMLQQTRVDTVIPYYLNFMRTFPSIEALSQAEEDTLLKTWEGLGYYSRVRNLQKAAIQIMEEYNGEMPRDPKEIIKLKGIGPYTTGAIASMAFGLPEPAVDGNIMRILSRLFEIDADIAVPANRKLFEEILREIIDPYRPGDFNQALMDLGATICTPKNYHPEKSPVKEFNQSYLNGTWEKYPVKSKKKKAKPVYYAGVVISNQKGELLLEKRPSNGLLASMWTFPLLEESQMSQFFAKGKFVSAKEETSDYSVDELNDQLDLFYGIKPILIKEPIAGDTHIFSHLKWHMAIYYGELPKNDLIDSIPEHCAWVKPEDFDQYTFPGPQMKMWAAYKNKFLEK